MDMSRIKKILKRSAIVIISIILLIASIGCQPQQQSDESLNIRNVILMIGDGMGINHIIAGETYYERDFYMRKDPDASGFVTTQSLDSDVTDSAAAATAMACGKKTKNNYVGKDENGVDMQNIMEKAIRKGKKTGIVVTCNLDDATPGAFSAHVDDRHFFDVISQCQIRSGIDLFMGLQGHVIFTEYEMMDAGYTHIKEAQNLSKEYDKIWAVMPSIRPEETADENSSQLKDLAAFALEFLENENGFMLMIEGSNIDKKSHDKRLPEMLYELNAFDLAVKTVLDWAEGREDTLVIVTADHETGGLMLLSGLSKNTLNLTAKFSTSGHTSTDVPYFIFGINEKNKPQAIIDNTDIFKLCNKFIK